ncbi:MAG: SAM-dependent methyltransferase [Alphaproteobacteria bacterium]|nr:SAM-dependent methyltransferase [Alphaproteobacteria bacterium]
MSGFSAEWLALREGVDHRSTNAQLRARLAQHFADRDVLEIVDLGAGSGSNLRGLAPFLNQRQHWRLAEYDPALIAAARVRLSAWADSVREKGDALLLRKGNREIEVEFCQTDLSSGVESVLETSTALVTAAAFFDLVSKTFIEGFCAGIAQRKLAFYTVLTYDGREEWTPAHEADADMLAAFHAHQATDKGFGAAAGPAATQALRMGFERAGYNVATAASDWRLAQADASLIRELAKGSASAVAETGKLAPQRIESWRMARLDAQSCLIGHQDLLALS